jgi:hypothetical protein
MRTLLTWIGGLLSLAGFAFVVQRLLAYAGHLDLASLGPLGYGSLLLLSVAYGAANCLLAAGWWQVLRGLKVPVRLAWAVRVYAISQLAKYIPGNVFQFVGRQALGLAAGLGNGPLLKSTVLELLVLAGAGAVFVPLVVPDLVLGWTPSASFVDAVPSWGWGAGVVLAIVLGFWLLWRFGGPPMVGAGFFYGTFVILSGVVFAACFAVAGGAMNWAMSGSLIGAYIVAWLVGLLTPGAPAGLGMREAVLLLLLPNVGTEPVILTAILFSRAVTVVGDVGFYLAAGLLPGVPTDTQKTAL